MRPGRCNQCERFSKQLLYANRYGGGNYRRSGRYYRSSICKPCAERLVANAVGQPMETKDRWTVSSLKRALEQSC